MLLRNWVPALCAAVLALSTGCGQECVDAFDCRNEKGAPPEGQMYACVENKCELRDISSPEPTDGGTDGGEEPTDGGPTDGGSTDAGVTCSPACGAGEVCDVSSGKGVCKTCTATEGCSGDTPICDTAANKGKGVCKACTSNAGCSGDTPVCDTAANSGIGQCKTCTEAAGCSGATPVCDITANSGAGQCKTCTESAGCTAPQFCDTTASSGAGQCKSCVDSTQASDGVDRGCTVENAACDTSVNGGVGECKVCVDAPTTPAGSDQGCASPTTICDPSANSGKGACKVCVGNEGCGTLTCRADGMACENCADDTSCPTATPVCETTTVPTACYECSASNTTLCGASKPACTNNACGCTDDAQCAAVADSTLDFCDKAANNGRGGCVVCVDDASCQGLDAARPFCINQAACAACRNNADCGVGQVCDASNACVAATPAPSAASAELAAVLAKPAGALDPKLSINGAYVTYVKPALGDDLQGYFLQAEASGPALFVESDPGTLKVGDRVSLTVGEVALLSKSTAATSGVIAARLVEGLTVLSGGHPVQNLSTATPAGLLVDHTATADLVSAVNNYASELIRLRDVKLTDNLFGSGAGHVHATITTAGVTTGTALKLRLPAELASEIDLVKDCTLTLNAGPLWKYVSTSTTVQPSAYRPEDISSISCPAPRLTAALPVSSTQVRLVFDRHIDAASITDAKTQFTFTNGLEATAATVNGREVLVTTTAQTRDQEYSASVAASVMDTIGKAVTTPNAATFSGYAGLTARGGRLAVSGSGFTGATSVTIGGVAQPSFTVDSDTQLTIASVADDTPVGTAQPVQVTTPAGTVSGGEATVLHLVINELDADQSGTDAAEFVEIATGVPNLKVSGFTLVLFNGANDSSYLALDINATTDSNGLLLAANSVLNPSPGLTIPGSTLQNGQDAAAIYQSAAALFPSGTPVTTNGLIDALVYTVTASATPTNASDDIGLLNGLLWPESDPRRVQVDEDKNNLATSQSIQRCGTARRDGSIFQVAAPTAGAANTCP